MTVRDDDPAGIGVLSRDVAVLTARYETINGKLAALDAKFDALTSELARSRQTPWPLIISGLMAAMVMVGGGWTLVDLQTRLTVAQQTTPISANLTHLDAAVAEYAARLTRLAEGQQRQGDRVTAIERDLRETEAQFCWLSDQVNLRLAGRGRLIDLLWERVMGQRISPEADTQRVGRCSQS